MTPDCGCRYEHHRDEHHRDEHRNEHRDHEHHHERRFEHGEHEHYAEHHRDSDCGHPSDCSCRHAHCNRCGHDSRHDHHHHCGCRCHGPGGGGGKGEDGTTVGWHNPDRPGRHCGTSTGEVPGAEVEPGNFGTKPPNEWPGQRGDLFLPFLFMRANPGDLGARPVVGPFWESPDVLLLAGVEPSVAPRVPPALGQTALAGKPNTIYAHVWNFGLAQAPNVVVEFYWCDPSLGIGPTGANLIGVTTVSLGARSSGRSHAVVKCPTPWVPTFVNGGHECLVVRIWDETSDGIGTPPWDAALNRHIGQRNIHVVSVGGQDNARMTRRGDLDAPLLLPAPLPPLTLKVGPLYGEPARVTVERAAPHQMPWLQLHTGVRGQFPAQAMPTGDLQLSAPMPIGAGLPGGAAATAHEVTGDDKQVAFSTGDVTPAPGEAHVYRVTASQQGQVFGGYTVVLLG
ncbi:MAG: hypothetical protein ABI912_01375 [Actinomycetota bacterium]